MEFLLLERALSQLYCSLNFDAVGDTLGHPIVLKQLVLVEAVPQVVSHL